MWHACCELQASLPSLRWLQEKLVWTNARKEGFYRTLALIIAVTINLRHTVKRTGIQWFALFTPGLFKSTRELLRSGLPSVVNIVSYSQSTQYSSYPWSGMKVSLWKDFLKEVRNTIGLHERHLYGKQLLKALYRSGQGTD